MLEEDVHRHQLPVTDAIFAEGVQPGAQEKSFSKRVLGADPSTYNIVCRGVIMQKS